MTDHTARFDKEPFEQIPHWLLMDTSISANALRIWLVLRKHRNYTTGECWPGRQRLAKLCGVSIKTVDRELPKLAEAGAITITKRRTAEGDADTNLYHVHWEQGGYTQGGDILTPRSDKIGRGGGVTESHKLIPMMNKEGVPRWIESMEDGPEHDAAYLAFLQGKLA